MHSQACTCVLWLLSWLLTAPVNNPWPVTRGTSHEPDPYRFDPAIVKTLPRAFVEDAPACTLYTASSHLIEADGTIETIVHEVTRLNSRKGIEKLGEYRHIVYDPGTQKLTLNEARVRKPDGRVVPIEPRHVQLRDVSTDFSVYEQDRQLVISFPNLQVGDIIEVKWTTRGRNPSFDGRFFTRYTFGDAEYPVVHDEFRVVLPKESPFHFAALGGRLEPSIRDQGQRRLHRWTVRNRPPLPQDSDRPPSEELRLQVMCSTFSSWDEVGRWKQKLRAHCWECTPELKKVVQEVTRGQKTLLEKARALTYWVRQNIRYVSVMSARGGYTPQVPVRTLANLYGDCKDQSQLLAVLLRSLGLKVELVTLGTIGDGQVVESVPSPWGTHAILLVHIDGQEHWIDTTSTLAGWNFLPRTDRDRICYLTDEQGKLRLHRTPPMSYQTNRLEQTTHVHVQTDGTVQCVRKLRYHGSAAMIQRENWLDAALGERRRLMTAELQDANSRSRLLHLEVDERRLRNLDQPVEATLEYQIPAHFGGKVEKEASFTDSKVWGRLLAYNLDLDRKVAMDLWAPFESVHRHVIHLPPAYRFDGLPLEKSAKARWGWFRLRVQRDPKNPRRLELESHIRLEKTRVQLADFAEFRRFHQEVHRAYRVWVSLTPTTEVADAAHLEGELAAHPGDLVTATVLAKLYQRQRKLPQARRVLETALTQHPSDRALWDQLVAATETLEQEEAALLKMLPRYPNDLALRLELAATRIQLGQHGEAEKLLLRVLGEGAPALRARAHYQLARSASERNQPEKAAEHLQSAWRVDPQSINNVTAWEFQGRVQEQLKQREEALKAYRQALLLQPQRTEAMAAALRLECQGEPSPEVFDLLRRYALAVKGDLEGLVQAADFALRLGRLDDALELAKRSRDIDFHAGTQRVLGLVHFRRGQHDKAIFHLERAEPEADVVVALLRSHLARGKLTPALALLPSVERCRNATPELRQLVQTVTALGQRRTALLAESPQPTREQVEQLLCAEHALSEGQPLEKVVQMLNIASSGPELGPVCALRGLALLERGRLSQALDEAEKATRLSPREARGFYVRGRVRLERGDQLALPDLLRAAELSQRREGHILHWLGQAQFQAGRFAEALATQAQAVQLQPGNRDFSEQLRRFEEMVKRQ